MYGVVVDMNEVIRKIALDSHLLNYVDNETPRYYFVCGNAEEEEVQLFALKCIRHAIALIEEEMHEEFANNPKWYKTIQKIEDTFRIQFSDAEKALDEMVEINQKLGLYDE
jgi:hypothetical protein